MRDLANAFSRLIVVLTFLIERPNDEAISNVIRMFSETIKSLT